METMDAPEVVWIIPYADGFEGDCDVSQDRYNGGEQVGYIRICKYDELKLAADELADAVDEFSGSGCITLIRVLNALTAYRKATGDI